MPQLTIDHINIDELLNFVKLQHHICGKSSLQLLKEYGLTQKPKFITFKYRAGSYATRVLKT